MSGMLRMALTSAMLSARGRIFAGFLGSSRSAAGLAGNRLFLQSHWKKFWIAPSRARWVVMPRGLPLALR